MFRARKDMFAACSRPNAEDRTKRKTASLEVAGSASVVLWRGLDAKDKNIVHEAILAGADLNEKRFLLGQAHTFPICEAIGTPELTLLLLEHGANPNVRDWNDSSPLESAIATFESELEVALLLAHGADPNFSDSEGFTPLMVAAAESGPIAIRLIKAGADVNARTITGWTVLMAFSVQGLPKFVEILLKCGANPFDRDKDGMTPCSHARKNARSDVESVFNKFLNL